ncbi:MAG: hypothetical protein LAO79_19035 [Acidobacteriia bacterium]|nr:hypothetical protein [Terriglobia bacterium]
MTELSPDNANTWAQLGRYQLSAGHNEDGAKSFDRALAMPHAAVVENNAAYYLAESGYQLDRARQLILGTLEPAARRVCEPEEITKDNKCAVALTAIANWLDTAAWVIYKEGKVKESEAYARSAWAISARPTMGAHLSLILAVSGRIEEALKIFSEARTRPGFDTADDLADARAALAKAAGADFEARRSTKDEEANVRVVALVEGSGKVVKAEAFDPQTPAAAVTAAKSLMLAPIAWGEHSLRSIRTVELRQDGDNWVVVRSAVGQPVN